MSTKKPKPKLKAESRTETQAKTLGLYSSLSDISTLVSHTAPKRSSSVASPSLSGFYPHTMPKNRSSRTPVKVQENPATQEEGPSSLPKKLGSEIDEIFAGKKRKKPQREKNEKSNKDVDEMPRNIKKKKKNEKGSKDDILSDQPSRSRKRTEDGLAVYTEEELGISKGDAGGTPLCPFDCSCCF